MTDVKRLGLGCMGMNLSNKDRAIETIHYALDHGVTLLNTGEFYGGGESKLVLREALKGVPRDKYFLSVKFGVLPRRKKTPCSPGFGKSLGRRASPWNIWRKPMCTQSILTSASSSGPQERNISKIPWTRSPLL